MLLNTMLPAAPPGHANHRVCRDEALTGGLDNLFHSIQGP